MAISIDTVAKDEFNNADRLGVHDKPVDATDDEIDGIAVVRIPIKSTILDKLIMDSNP